MDDPRVDEIFNAALHKGSAVERAAYLEGACGNNADLRSRVDTLLRAYDQAEGFMEPTSVGTSFAEGPGTMIGRYKLLQLIGEGGFGVVYMAEQVEPVRRKVALKIIKLGMDTRQVVARFESERQALALMDDPNIARVLDAGATDSGRPYFVMELVKGITITEYCDQNNLSPRERLELFMAVCRAVQHAHQKGIIHRDLKPSNVLVTLHDGCPVPKVIDFGIAKATNQRLTEKTLFTEFRQFIGTPQYMSPEQAEMSGLDVDTRSDIYSLGVLLYELLTGTTPFEAATLRAAGFGEMQRIIREEEPESPSMRVSTMNEGLVTIAKHRKVEPHALPKVFRGDLDWIVMKSLEKDRTRRYGTANDLAADISRYLNNEPVHASPPSVVYKLHKFVRRNRMAVGAGFVIIIGLLIGLAAASVGFMQARYEAERASREATRSQEIADFLQEILASVDPDEASKRNLHVDHVLTRARELFGNDHATVAATLSSLALQLQQSGNLDAAEPLYRESIRIWRSVYGSEHANVGITLGRLGALLRLKGDDVEAEQAFREAIQVVGTAPISSSLTSCDARSELAEILKRRGKFDEAETLVREVIRLRRSNPQGQEFQIAASLEQLVGILIMSGKNDAAVPVFEEMVQSYRPMFPADSLTAASHNVACGLFLMRHGKNQKAESYFREAIRTYRANPNPPREYFLAALDGLFQILRSRQESTEETIALFHETMENMAYLYGHDHLLIAPHLFGFARMLDDRNHSAEAIPLVVDGIRIYRQSKGADWDARSSLEMLERFVRRVALASNMAKPKYTAAVDGAEVLLAEKPLNASLVTLLGISQYRTGQYDDALKNLDRTAESQPAEASDSVVLRKTFLAATQFRLGQVDKARVTYSEVQEMAKDQNIVLSKDAKAAIAEVGSLVAESASKS